MNNTSVDNNISGIYQIKNTVNGKIYVGYSSNIKNRFRHHRSCLKNNIHENNYLQFSWNKYGSSLFTFDIVEECEVDMMIEREIYWIKKLKANERAFGFNLNNGGTGNTGWVPSPETITKKSNSVTGEKNPMYGKKHSDDTKEIFSKQRIDNKNGVGNKNNLNKLYKRKNATSVYYGVFRTVKRYKNIETDMWYSRISVDGKEVKLGIFYYEIEAAKAFDKKS